jgi:hypothetical protein
MHPKKKPDRNDPSVPNTEFLDNPDTGQPAEGLFPEGVTVAPGPDCPTAVMDGNPNDTEDKPDWGTPTLYYFDGKIESDLSRRHSDIVLHRHIVGHQAITVTAENGDCNDDVDEVSPSWANSITIDIDCDNANVDSNIEHARSDVDDHVGSPVYLGVPNVITDDIVPESGLATMWQHLMTGDTLRKYAKIPVDSIVAINVDDPPSVLRLDILGRAPVGTAAPNAISASGNHDHILQSAAGCVMGN